MHVCEAVCISLHTVYERSVGPIAESSLRADRQSMAMPDIEFYCVGTDPQSPGSRGASRGSSCILSLNLTSNKTNEPPGSAQHVRKHAALAG